MESITKLAELNNCSKSEFAFRYFAEQGCSLLDRYTGAIAPMRYICKCGKEGRTSWNNFTKGKRCGYCHESGRKKKYTLDELKAFYREHGCELLESEYLSNKQKLRFICRCGKEHIKQLNEFKKQPRCWDCYMESRSGENHHAWVEDREEHRLKRLFKKKCYKALSSTLKAVGNKKVGRTTDMLGYTPDELRQHIEKHPNWKRVKDKKWSLDHIFPIEAFVDYGITDVRIINSLSNLQPILLTENSSKRDKYDVALFEAWLILTKKEDYYARIATTCGTCHADCH